VKCAYGNGKPVNPILALVFAWGFAKQRGHHRKARRIEKMIERACR
jgi:hypothetical protein